MSGPKQLTLPEEPFYPVERLLLFDRQNRLTWEQTFGEQAPPWDKERRIKRWADTSAHAADAPDTVVEYEYFDMVTRTFKKFAISAFEASLPNLPGKYVYPKYIVEPTPAVVVEAGSPNNAQGLNPNIICQYAEAAAIAAQLSGQVVEATSFMAGPYSIDWRGETRRRWLIRIEGRYHNAAALVQAKNACGVGAPGDWIYAANDAGPRWVSEAQDTGDQDPRPEIPIPCRVLFPEEAIWHGMAGMKTLIYRKDMESVFNSSEPSEQVLGGLTAEQAATLGRIDANLTHLLSLLFQPPS